MTGYDFGAKSRGTVPFCLSPEVVSNKLIFGEFNQIRTSVNKSEVFILLKAKHDLSYESDRRLIALGYIYLKLFLPNKKINMNRALL